MQERQLPQTGARIWKRGVEMVQFILLGCRDQTAL